jgi:ATP-dependent RNA helicase RhlE
MNFDDLKLAPAILKAVHEQGYEIPTPIQAQAIPAVLEGHDLLAGAQTGTGKTAAFVLPMLDILGRGEAGKNKFGGTAIRALVLTPTRELAAQVEESVQDYGKHVALTSTVVFGGVGMNPQISKLKRRRRHPGGHARAPARPAATGLSGPFQRADPGARRGRPHARHGLHP